MQNSSVRRWGGWMIVLNRVWCDLTRMRLKVDVIYIFKGLSIEEMVNSVRFYIEKWSGKVLRPDRQPETIVIHQLARINMYIWKNI